MIFRLMGVDVTRLRAHYGEDTIMGDEVSQMIRNLHNSKEYDLPRSKIFLFSTPRPNELLCNCTRIIGRDGRELNPMLVEDITEAGDPGPQAGPRIRQILQGQAGRLRELLS